MGQWRQFPVAIALVALVGGCTPQFRDYGYAPTNSQLAQIKVGVTSRDQVAQLVGYPDSLGMTKNDPWLYIASRQETVGFKAPKTTAREVVVITFRTDGTVQNIERFGLKDGRIIVLNRRVTDSNTKGISFLRQALRNLGRFNSSDVTKQGQGGTVSNPLGR
jgi:outer membrane protein assembly factor BamE (lipoprotein component of BamABCDE complex)